MPRKQWVMAAVTAAGILALGGWWLIDRQFSVPSSLVGTWENETPILDAGPGEVRLTVQRDGTAVATFDRDRYVWFGTGRYRCRVRGRGLILRAEPDGEPVALRIEIDGGRFRVWDPDSPRPGLDELVFRRVGDP